MEFCSSCDRCISSFYCPAKNNNFLISSLETWEGKVTCVCGDRRFLNASGWHFGRILCLSCEVFNYGSAAVWGGGWRGVHPRVLTAKAFQSDKPLPTFALIIRFFSAAKFSRADSLLSTPLCRSDAHCHPLLSQAILDVVINLQFSLIEKLWQTFWRYSPPDSVEGATVTENR